MNHFHHICIQLLAFIVGWCFCEAYITGPEKHRKLVMKEAMQHGFAHEDIKDGNVVIVWNKKD